MITKIFGLATLLFLILTSCQSKTKNTTINSDTVIEQQPTAIHYDLAKNYFVKSTVKKIENPKIETIEQFNQIFGMAITMGINGKPTAIDFAKKYVIAVILPETDLKTTVQPVSLKKNKKGEITLKYKIEIGDKQSYTTVPFFAIIVAKTDDGELIVTELK
ncbi:hypothetical protein [Flavobacterium sp. PL12]|uniref:hypothetical protein n=1 Tax=Flavobacterium sp. PL12 TaxID=3071718 RepID=UPI00319DF67A